MSFEKIRAKNTDKVIKVSERFHQGTLTLDNSKKVAFRKW
jgi:hypothetical protein